MFGEIPEYSSNINVKYYDSFWLYDNFGDTICSDAYVLWNLLNWQCKNIFK